MNNEIESLRNTISSSFNELQQTNLKLQTDLSASEVRLAEVKESTKSQLQEAMDTIRTLSAEVVSKGQQIERIEREMQATSKADEERLLALQEQLRKALEEKSLADSLSAELTSKINTLQDQLVHQQNEITLVTYVHLALNLNFLTNLMISDS